MRFVRGSVLVIAVILLFISLFVGNIFWTVSSSLQYEIVYPQISSFINHGYGMSSYIENNYNTFLDYCSPHENYTYKSNLGNFVIPCSNVSSGIDSTLNFVLEQNSSLREQKLLVAVSNEIINLHPMMNDYCSPHELYVSNISGINMSCEKVILGKEQLTNSVMKSSVDEIYYRQYNCNFFDCLSKTGSPFFLVSKKAVDYWNSKFYLSILISFILLILIFFLLKNKLNLFFVAGFSFIFSSLPLLKLQSFLLFLIKLSFNLFSSNSLLNGFGYINSVDPNIILSVISVFFSQYSLAFLVMFILGILLVVAGIVLKFWSYFSGRTKHMFSRKEVENIVRAEIKKSNQSKK